MSGIQRFRLLSLILLMLMFGAGSACAAVPNGGARPAYAEEQTILQQEKGVPEPGWDSAASGRQHFDRHYVIPPGFMDAPDLILQRGGNTWRHLRNGPLALIAGTLLILVPLLIYGFHRAVGPAPAVPESGESVQRFSYWDRLVHWSAAITFLVLAASGVVILFGKKVLLPWMGHTVYYWFALVAKTLHNFVGPLFIFCSIALFLTFLRKNLFARHDWQWLKKGGGLLKHEHIPAGFFNAGEKLWFWGGVALLGLLMSATGLMLDFSYFKTIGEHFAITRYLLQIADTLHIAGAALYIAASMGHIYIGTWGTPGTYRGIRDGNVDVAWVREHHELWYDDIHGRPASDRPAPAALLSPRP